VEAAEETAAAAAAAAAGAAMRNAAVAAAVAGGAAAAAAMAAEQTPARAAAGAAVRDARAASSGATGTTIAANEIGLFTAGRQGQHQHCGIHFTNLLKRKANPRLKQFQEPGVMPAAGEVSRGILASSAALTRRLDSR
jgi:hypothetical protein